jgi:hypothetical protein
MLNPSGLVLGWGTIKLPSLPVGPNSCKRNISATNQKTNLISWVAARMYATAGLHKGACICACVLCQRQKSCSSTMEVQVLWPSAAAVLTVYICVRWLLDAVYLVQEMVVMWQPGPGLQCCTSDSSRHILHIQATVNTASIQTQQASAPTMTRNLFPQGSCRACATAIGAWPKGS